MGHHSVFFTYVQPKGAGLARYYLSLERVEKIRTSVAVFGKSNSCPKETVHDRSNGEHITNAFDPAQVDRSGVHDGKPAVPAPLRADSVGARHDTVASVRLQRGNARCSGVILAVKHLGKRFATRLNGSETFVSNV